MWLINAGTLLLELFPDEQELPPYAILSHRWGNEEISLGEMTHPHASTHTKQGYWKIQATCRQAMKDGLSHVWIDTCCIDKRSSAELSEAVNSMYRWYSNAVICYAYLYDIQALTVDGRPPDARDVEHSEWFTRAWTLQELIAPKKLLFFDANFTALHDREHYAPMIYARTGILRDILTKKMSPLQCRVCEVMTWASQRKATRAEDVAYSLMGLFDINMPLLYGEGNKAFIRLQEEIIKKTPDQSIFLCSFDSSAHPLFAASPADFKWTQQDIRTGNVHLLKGSDEPKAYSLTNVGLSITLMLTPWKMNLYLARLELDVEYTGGYHWYLVLSRYSKNIYRRASDDEGNSLLMDGQVDHQLLQCYTQSLNITIWAAHNPPRQIRRPPATFFGMKVVVTDRWKPETFSSDEAKWDLEYARRNTINQCDVDQAKWEPEGNGTGLIRFWPSWAAQSAVLELFWRDSTFQIFKVRFDYDFKPVCVIGQTSHNARAPSYFDWNRSKWQRFLSPPLRYDLIAKDTIIGKSFDQVTGLETQGWVENPENGLLGMSSTEFWAFKGLGEVELKRDVNHTNYEPEGLTIRFYLDEIVQDGLVRTLWVLAIEKSWPHDPYLSQPHNMWTLNTR